MRAGKIVFILSSLSVALLSWLYIEVQELMAFNCRIAAGNPCPAHSTPVIPVIIALFVLTASSALVGLFGEGRLKERKRIDMSKLSADERKVMQMLVENGSMYQGNIVKLTGFTKVKVSRILDRLEEKGLVERKRRGMANMVVLRE